MMHEIFRLWWRMKVIRFLDRWYAWRGSPVCWSAMVVWAFGLVGWDLDQWLDDGRRCAREKGGCYCWKYHPEDGE